MSETAVWFALGMILGLAIGVELARRAYAATAEMMRDVIGHLDHSRAVQALRAELAEQSILDGSKG